MQNAGNLRGRSSWNTLLWNGDRIEAFGIHRSDRSRHGITLHHGTKADSLGEGRVRRGLPQAAHLRRPRRGAHGVPQGGRRAGVREGARVFPG